MTKFTFDTNKLRLVKKKSSFAGILLFILKWLGISFLIALGFYALLALVFSTDRERKIAAENEYMERQYKEMSQQLDVIEDVVASLEIRDKAIYQDVFHANPPSYVQKDTSTLDISLLYLETPQDIIWQTHKMSVDIDNIVYRTNRNIETINRYIDQMGTAVTAIPSMFPVKNFNIAQTGASIGMKVSPFLKNFTNHDGIDLMAPLGTDVLATADGVVTSVQKTQKGHGNSIAITHTDGYVTQYSHLSDILVRNGQEVKQGSVIGRVGSSGLSFVTHLHYSVFKDGAVVDPLNYFFSEIDSNEYGSMLKIAMNTGQSMD